MTKFSLFSEVYKGALSTDEVFFLRVNALVIYH